jgi:hypothetical protein
MPKYRVRGVLSWTEEMEELVDTVVWAEDEQSALEQAAEDEWGIGLGNDLLHQNSFFSDDTEVEEVGDDAD